MLSAKDKNGYGSIPDIEEGITSDSPQPTALTPAQKYPEANDQELAFLIILDEAMANSKPKIDLPTIKATDLGEPPSVREFVDSLLAPSAAFAISAATALWIMGETNPTTQAVAAALFPYYSCILVFAATVIPTKYRFNAWSGSILSKIDVIKQSTTDKVEAVSSIALRYVTKAETTKDDVLRPIEAKLEYATKIEVQLQRIDPTIDIPDISDIDEAFDGFADVIENAADKTSKAVDVSRKVPKAMESQKNLELYVFYPVMCILLLTQLLLVWITSQAVASMSSDEINADINVTSVPAEVDTAFRGLLRGSMTNVTDFVETSSSISDDSIISLQEDPSQMQLLIISLQTYVTAIIQLVVTYVMTHYGVLAKEMNRHIKNIEDDVNETLDLYAGPVFKFVFDDGFGGVKEKFLDLVHKMEKIEGPLRKLDKMTGGKMGSALLALKDGDFSADNMKRDAERFLRGKAMDLKGEAEERALEMKAQAEQKARDAKEEAERKAREAAEQAKVEAERKKRELEEKARAEAERKKRELEEKAAQAKEEAERKAREAEEQARAEAERLKQEAERKAREAKEEAERKAREAEEQARAEAERLKQEAERKAREAKEEAERKAKEAAEKKAQAEKMANSLQGGFKKFGF